MKDPSTGCDYRDKTTEYSPIRSIFPIHFRKGGADEVLFQRAMKEACSKGAAFSNTEFLFAYEDSSGVLHFPDRPLPISGVGIDRPDGFFDHVNMKAFL